jgi:hypothetical protein
MMEIVIRGTGEFVVVLIDSQGTVLMRKRLVISGSPKVEAKSRLPLALQTRDGEVPVVPVLIRSAARSVVTFAGKKPAVFTGRRCKELGLAHGMVKKAAKAAAKVAEQRGIHLSLSAKANSRDQ